MTYAAGLPYELRCGCTEYLKKDWCRHLQLVMTREYDGRDANGVRPLFQLVSVPLFRSPNMAVPVVVLDANEQGFRKVGVKLQSQVDEDVWTLDLLGYVIDGQGRKSLRTLVMDWLNERGAHGDYEQCASSYHGSASYKFTPSTDPLSKSPISATAVKHNFADLASLILTGWCYECSHSAGIPEV